MSHGPSQGIDSLAEHWTKQPPIIAISLRQLALGETWRHGSTETGKIESCTSASESGIWDTGLQGPAVFDANPPCQAARYARSGSWRAQTPPSRSDPCSVSPPSKLSCGLCTTTRECQHPTSRALTRTRQAGRQAGTHCQHTCRPTSNENAPRGEQNNSPPPRPPRPPPPPVLPQHRRHAERRARAPSPHYPFPKTQSHDADADAPTPMALPPRPRSLPVPLVGRKTYRCIPSS